MSSLTGGGKGLRTKKVKVTGVMELTQSERGGLGSIRFHAGTFQERPTAHCPEATLGSYRRAGSSALGCGNC